MKRREVDDYGRIECGLCEEWIHISGFYTRPVLDGASMKDIWWGDPDTGKQYGQPKSYCRACNYVAQKGWKAVMERKAEFARRRAGRLSLADALREVEIAQQEAYAQVLRQFLDTGSPVE